MKSLDKEIEEIEGILAGSWVGVFCCGTCGKDFDSLDELTEHTSKKKHTGTGLWK